MTTEALLSGQALCKRVNDGRHRREVLRGVSLEVRRGEIVVIGGPSGSGKTTLLALLGGMLLPTSGEVWIEGEAISRLRDRHRAELRRKKIGYLFQDFGLLEKMSVLDNVLIPLVPEGVAMAAGAQRAIAMLERLGVGALQNARAEALSGGERQRVALARALIREPSVVLLDEPTAHLDADRAAAIVHDLRGLAAEGRALVVTSHDPRVRDAAGVTRILELRDGQLS